MQRLEFSCGVQYIYKSLWLWFRELLNLSNVIEMIFLLLFVRDIKIIFEHRNKNVFKKKIG